MLKRLILFGFIVLTLMGCEGKNTEPLSRSGFLLGTVISVNIYDSNNEAVFDEIFKRLESIESKMSKTIVDSEVSRLNEIAYSNDDAIVQIDEEVFYVIEKALEYGELSNGMFDITLAPIVELWGIGSEYEQIPDDKMIEMALVNVGLDKIEVTSENHIRMKQGTQIDLGGIAKGYAADIVAEIIEEHGIESAIINLGGNVKVIGSKKGNNAFAVGIQDPLSERNDYLGILSVKDKTIVASGDYERYFERDGKRYHHIFDPTTGYPYETDIASVTVITTESIVADAMSTILYLMDVESGLKLVNSMEDIECIYVTKDKRIYLSNGDVMSDFELTSSQYTIENR